MAAPGVPPPEEETEACLGSSSRLEIVGARALVSKQRRARARGPTRRLARFRSGRMGVETRSRLAGAHKAKGTRARSKARAETAFEANADSVADPHFFSFQLGAPGRG